MSADDHKRFDDIFGDSEEDFNGYSEAKFQAALGNRKTVVDAFEDEDGSPIFVERSVAVEETVDAEIEMISEQPTAIDGIFYQIEDGWITANVHDMADNLKIRFIGIDEDKHQHAMLLQSDVDAAEKYRAEMETMFSEE